MLNFFKPSSTLIALFIFLPITPSIAALTVFTKFVLDDRNTNVTYINHHSSRVIDAARN